MTDLAINAKIDTFLKRKTREYPEIQQMAERITDL